VADATLKTIDRWYIRCLCNPGPFDLFAANAKSSPDWRHRELDAPHLPFITHPDAVVGVLLEVAVEATHDGRGARPPTYAGRM
jgi:hypothetical protein